ncbi:MAG: KTSC domain-containing protein [Candidatus Heimdallarchaeota archaeon]|nr:KTSC domain-containing protein [Candidatus Heimdallarchaeota archaeon]
MMSDKILFIDANVYLRFYDTSNPRLKSLPRVLAEIKEKIFITEQIRDEVNRNKLQVAINSFSANFKDLGIKKAALPENFDEHHDKKLSKWNKQRTKIIDQENVLKNEYPKIVSDILMSIMKSTDNVSAELDKVFNLSKTPSQAEIKLARIRKELGNPPGKSADPLGDQLSWEQFLSIYDGKEIWIITNDNDFFSYYERRRYLNPFLYNELKNKINNNPPPINIFDSLSEGIEDFRIKTDCQIETLPSSEEMKQIISEEAEVHIIMSSNIQSIAYNKATSILVVEFYGGATYQYYQVPEEVYLAFLAAGSHGRFFDQHVKRAGFQYAKII